MTLPSIALINQNWLQRELMELGHRVISISLDNAKTDLQYPHPGRTIDDLLTALPFKPDRIVWFDDSGLMWFRHLDRCRIPMLFYSVDSHHHNQWHPEFGTLFDALLVAQRDFLPTFSRLNRSVAWMPLWAPLLPEPAAEKSINISFVGNLDPSIHPNRAKFFGRLNEIVPVTLNQGDYTQYYTRAKIVVNQAVKDDLNFRVFEAMACGAMLITPEISQGLAELFTPGKELVTYRNDDAEDAARKAIYYLQNDSERKAIAAAGRQSIIDHHSPMARAKQLSTSLTGLVRAANSHRSYGLALSAFITDYVTVRDRGTWSGVLLLDAAAALVEAARGEAETKGDALGLAALLVDTMRDRGMVKEAESFLASLRQAARDSVLVMICSIVFYKETGREAEAFALARQLTGDPAEVVREARALLELQLRPQHPDS